MKRLVLVILGVLLFASNVSADIFGSVDRLQDLLDVNISSPADNDVLSYDSASGKWINEVGGAGSGDITSVGDCTTGACSGANITWGSGAGFTQTFDAGASDPVWTYSSGIANLSTGTLQVGGTAVLTAEVDGSITNELPIAGTYIDISGSPASTVDVDTTEMEAVTFGAGGNASNIWTFNLSGTDTTITFGSDLFTLSGSLTLGTGKNFTLGTTQWNSGDGIDGTKIANADLGEIGVSSGVWSVENATVIGKVLTGFSSGSGAVAATDTILQAFNKIDGNVAGKQAADADLTTWAGITPGANVGTFLATPSSANLLAAVTDETGSASGSPLAVFNQGPTINGATLTGTIDAGGAVLEIPNGTSGTTDATGETYLDTNGDGGTNFSGEVVQIYTGATNKYLFPIALPLAASQDNYVMKYDASGKTVQWEAEASGSPVTYSKSFIITNPTSSADSPTWEVPNAITMSAIHLLCVGGTNVVGQLWEYDSNGANGSTVDSADITSTAGTTANDDGSLSNPGIAAGNWLGWKTTSVSGSPTKAIVTFDYTID